MNDATLSTRGILDKWIEGGNILQLVASAVDGIPKFDMVVHLVSADAEKWELSVPYVPYFLLKVSIPSAATVGVGSFEGSSQIAEYAEKVKPPWVVLRFSDGFMIALGELI